MNLDEAGWREQTIRDAVLAGEATAWRALYNAHFEPLHRYALWRCGGRADLAEEVVQETWLTAVRRLRSFEPAKGAFFAWLSGIAANAARNALRSRRRRQARSHPLRDMPNQRPDDGASEKAERVATALDALPDHYEAVLRAKYLDQQTVEQIAAARGDSMKAIESLLTRARQAFREAYGKSNHD